MEKKGSGKRKAGVIVRRMAESCLVELCYTEIESRRIAERGDLGEIERLTGAVSILDAVVHRLCPVLASRDKITPPEYLFSVLLYSEAPEEELGDFFSQFERYNQARKAELIMLMLSAAHDEWVKLHDKVFFDPDKEYLQCRFLPVELIGFDTARWYLIYVGQLLDVFNWIVDEKLVLIAYRAMQDSFYLQNEISSDEKLIVYVADANYKALSPMIKRALKGNTELARRMIYS